MAEALVLEKLDRADWIADNLRKVEDALRDAAHVVGQTAAKTKGTALAFENAWRRIVINVANGQTAEMQAAKPGLMSEFEQRLNLLKQAYTLLAGLHKRGRADLDPDFLLSEIAGMERLKARVFDHWQSADDLEDLAARDYPLTTADLDQIGPQRRPPDLWYSEESKPF